MRTVNKSVLVRPHIARLHPYTPGEQPQVKGLIKLNTNENPYPPSPLVLEAVRAAVDDRLRLYPNPAADGLRAKLARLHRCSPDNIIVGNGSDELLALAVRAFVDPAPSWQSRSVRRGRCQVQYFTPSYSLYPVLADINGSARNAVPLNPDFSLPALRELRKGRRWDLDAALTFITTPNAPSGRAYATAELEDLCRLQSGVVLLDEAYVDFAEENALGLALYLPNVLVARTFSKAYSLCFQRVGYCVGPAELISALQKIRDSYNVNGLGQIAAEATLNDLAYYRANFKRVIETRSWLSTELARAGFSVFPSQTNFILVRPPGFEARVWLELLREHKILVRWFDLPGLHDCLRISIGTPEDARKLVQVCHSLTKF
jgi:histidinol-phosphate aminotransferase